MCAKNKLVRLVACFGPVIAPGQCGAHAQTIKDNSAGGEAELMIDGQPIPADEGVFMDRISQWLDKLHWTPGWETGETSQNARTELRRLANMIQQAPWIALGLGQAFLLYFWWSGDGLEVDVASAQLSAFLHHVSIRFAGCDRPELPYDAFLGLKCSWRWRHVLMITSELAVHLSRQRSQLRLVAALFRETNEIFATMRQLPHFRRAEWPSSSSINSNADWFPGPVNRPIWSSKGLPFAEFLEENSHIFKRDLDRLLSDGSFDYLYWTGEVSLSQFAARHEGWVMVSLYKNQQLKPKACELARESCAALASRPEIAHCTAGDSGAAFARMLPGQGLKPHFWNAPRLGAHLGLYTPPGATMWVGGEAVAWEEGKVTVFDDTYVHNVIHEGTEPRYLLITWFCHPCDTERITSPPTYSEPLCQTTGEAARA